MGIRFFGTVCFVLAALFTVAAIKGLTTTSAGAVLIIPAAAAIALVIAGIRNYRDAG